MALKRGSKEFYDLQEQFERDMQSSSIYHASLDRERDTPSPLAFYCNGEVNNMFRAYMMGYEYAKSLARFGELPD